MARQGRLSKEEVLLVYEEIQKVPVELRGIDIRKALAIASQYKIYAYDAYFLECAQTARCSLLTLDMAMKKIALEAGIKVLEMEV